MIAFACGINPRRRNFVARAAKFSFAVCHASASPASRRGSAAMRGSAAIMMVLACCVCCHIATAEARSQRILPFNVFNDMNFASMTFRRADMAVETRAGHGPGPIVTQVGASYDFAADARQRKHRRLYKAMIPAGPVIEFGKAVLQHEHRVLILSAIAAIGLQAAIIIGVLIHDGRRRRAEQSFRRRAEQSLKESEERMAFAAASTNTGFWQIEPTDWSLWTTDQCRILFGFAAGARLTLETLIERVHPEDRGIFAQTMRTAVQFRRPIVFEFRVLRPDGEVNWIAARGQPRDGDAGRSASFSGVFTDVTALKTAENDAELQRRQVAHLMRQSMLGELSGAIAHELNQPLTAILSNAETAQDLLNRKDVDLDQIRDILKDIIEDDQRAGEVIRRLRRLLRTGASKSEPIDLNQLVKSTLSLMHGELVRRRINIEITLSADMPASTGDWVQLQQVLLNLIMNAVEAMSANPPPQRELIITTRATDERVEAIITDRGHGLTPETRSQLFQPFFTTKEFGLGLGLSICSTIVKSHGGKLTVHNNDNGGATAMFTLPTRIATAPA